MASTKQEPGLPAKPAPPVHSDTVNAEHAVQLGLLDAAIKHASERRTAALEVIDQLHQYTHAHFMSEQLLMRLSAAPNFEGHQQEHESLLIELDEARKQATEGDLSGACDRLKAHETHLLQHIGTWDRSL